MYIYVYKYMIFLHVYFQNRRNGSMDKIGVFFLFTKTLVHSSPCNSSKWAKLDYIEYLFIFT